MSRYMSGSCVDLPFRVTSHVNQHHLYPPSNSSLNRLTLLCFLSSCATLSCEELDVPSVMYDSILSFDSCCVAPKPRSLRPPTSSNPEDPCDDVAELGEVTGDAAGEIAVLIFVVRLRKRGISKRTQRNVDNCQKVGIRKRNPEIRRQTSTRPPTPLNSLPFPLPSQHLPKTDQHFPPWDQGP
jgi:hypothetical protein